MTDHILKMSLDGAESTYILGPLAELELQKFAPTPPVYIIDETVAQRHPEMLRQIRSSWPTEKARSLVICGGESAKSLNTLSTVYDWLAELALPRDGTIVAVGGGTILDMAGMAAGTWRRGVNFISIPTTLLAMVDAAIGGKTAINAAGLKNPVGTFYPATGVLADMAFLSTLAARDWRDGLAELIKTAAIGDPALMQEMLAESADLRGILGRATAENSVPGIMQKIPWLDWIARAAGVKIDIVNKDFRERGPRKALNLGHTLGHALEAYSQGTPEPLSHGQAVAIGMTVVFRISTERLILPADETNALVQLLESCGLPTTWPAPPVDELNRLLAGDKKGSTLEGLKWILPERFGQMDVDATVTIAEVTCWLD